MNPDNGNEDSPPKLEEFNSLDKAIEAKIKYYKKTAEELAEDR